MLYTVSRYFTCRDGDSFAYANQYRSLFPQGVLPGTTGGFFLFWFGCSQQQKCHVATPPPARVRRRMERNRQKPAGRDKGSLTEQQTKGTGTTIQKRGIHKTNPQNRARRTQLLSLPDRTAAVPSRAVSELPTRRPPTGTPHDGTWYGIPCSVWPGGVSPPGCVPS